MSESEPSTSWVVYMVAGFKNAEGRSAVCEQSEWERMEQQKPGHYTLIRSGITNEGEAERLARGTSGDGFKSGYKKKGPVG